MWTTSFRRNMMEDLKLAIKQNISLNGGGFASPEVEALNRVFTALVDYLEDLEDTIDNLET